jgi:hypothetical protein
VDGAAANDALLQYQADLLGVPGRPRLGDHRPGAAHLAVWRSASGSQRANPPGIGRLTGGSSHPRRCQTEARRAEWREALNRSRELISGANSHAPV